MIHQGEYGEIYYENQYVYKKIKVDHEKLENEIRIHQLASEHGISPRIIETRKDGFIMERLDHTIMRELGMSKRLIKITFNFYIDFMLTRIDWAKRFGFDLEKTWKHLFIELPSYTRMAQFSRCYRFMMLDMNKIPELPFQPLVLFESKDEIRNKRRIIGKVIRLLHQLHDIGILHNDLHPENIMKSNDRYYFIDFGKSVTENINVSDDWFMLEYSFVYSFSYGRSIDYPVQIDLNYIRNDIKHLKDKINSKPTDIEIEDLIN